MKLTAIETLVRVKASTFRVWLSDAWQSETHFADMDQVPPDGSPDLDQCESGNSKHQARVPRCFEIPQVHDPGRRFL